MKGKMPKIHSLSWWMWLDFHWAYHIRVIANHCVPVLMCVCVLYCILNIYILLLNAILTKFFINRNWLPHNNSLLINFPSTWNVLHIIYLTCDEVEKISKFINLLIYLFFTCLLWTILCVVFFSLSAWWYLFVLAM